MFAPLVLLGFDPTAIFMVLFLNLLYQFWIHSEYIPKLGWFDRIFNSPANHRVHHASNPIYLDKNYGGVTMVFDHLFRSYQPELESEPCRYGLVHPLWSNNPFRIAFNEWIAMIGDVVKAETWRARFMHMFGPPAGLPTARARRRPTCSAPPRLVPGFRQGTPPSCRPARCCMGAGRRGRMRP
jgi:hypothetical protein